MAAFVQTWAKVEALELKNPLAQLGEFLRAQPNTGVDKQNFAWRLTTFVYYARCQHQSPSVQELTLQLNMAVLTKVLPSFALGL